jgi:hypothetical protein
MPHIPDNAGLPSSPKRTYQGTIPQSNSTTEAVTSGAGLKAKSGMLPTLSTTDYKPDQRLVDEAHGVGEAQHDDGMSKFRQPEFGG